MDKAPPITNIPEKEEETEPFFIDGNDNSLYQIVFKSKRNKILIKCHNTSDEIRQIYSILLNSENIKTTTQFNNLSQAFAYFKKLNNANCVIDKKDDHLLLYLNNSRGQNPIIIKLEPVDEEEEEEEEEDKIMNLQDAQKQISKLTKENKNFKKRIDYLEKNLEKIIKDFENYKNIMNSNFFYNSIDINLYKLDNIFNLLKSDIIKTKEEFGLINKGIKHLLNKNIIYFESKYKSKDDILDEREPQFSNQLKDLDYSVFLVLTKNKKKFGVFINQKNNIDNNNINNILNNFNYNNSRSNNKNMNRILMEDNLLDIDIVNNNNMNMNNNLMNINNINNNDMNMDNNMNNNNLLMKNDLLMNNNNMNNMNNNMNNMNNMNNNMNNMNNNNILMNNKYMNMNNMNMNNMNNNNMNNNMNNMNNNMNNMKDDISMNSINIFNSNISSSNYFVFSLDNLKIYYSNEQYEQNNNIPTFDINYDTKRQILYGTEVQSNIENDSSKSSLYLLSGKNEFNIKYCELFEIQIG